MKKLEVGMSHVAWYNVPPAHRWTCPSPNQVLRIRVVEADPDLVKTIEDDAWKVNYYDPRIKNDIHGPDRVHTNSSRVTHALEHLILITWIQTGYISLSGLKINEAAAMTVSGNDNNNNDLALLWFRKGLSNTNTLTSTVQSYISQYGGSYFSE